ncbi:unnamed protein product [Ilex paraguariensis]|uniref:non-specific serine/threonine protein kinase n=1 Tax=Ilex paraguariensis TaxID=185542 RepID=A0ABC8TNP0_9AQUA
MSGWSEKSDIFAFGVLFMMLITKRVHKEKGRSNVDEPFLHQWAQSQHTEKKSIMGSCSLVHHSLEADPDFVSSDGPRITQIAMQCVEYDPSRRPTMKQVVSYLLNLAVVQDHARDLGLA